MFLICNLGVKSGKIYIGGIMNIERNSSRLEYIDTAKAFLIILVVLGHVLIVLNPEYNKRELATWIQAFIYAFHMPAFFIIHGILLNGEKWKNLPARQYVFKRVYTLLIPYIFFEFIGIVWKMIFLNQALCDGLYNFIAIRCNVGADWFLPAMFAGSLGALIYVKLPGKVWGVISVVVCFLLPMFLPGQQLLVVLGRAVLAYGFIMIGYLGKELFLSEKITRISCLVAAFFLTAIAAVIGLKWGENDFFSCTVNNPVTLVVGGVSGTVLILGVSRMLHCRLLTAIGKYTLIIMGTHQLVIYMLAALTPDLYGGSFTKGIGILLLIILFEVPVIYICNRYLYMCVGRNKK